MSHINKTTQLDYEQQAPVQGYDVTQTYQAQQEQQQQREPRAFKVGADEPRYLYADWILWLLGFQFWIPFIVGAFLPLCRRPKWRDSWQKTAWMLNVIFAIVWTLFWIIFIAAYASAVAIAVKSGYTYNYNDIYTSPPPPPNGSG